ncbi:helix-turn-helix transcriptional regulator [Halorhodospira halochloris]|nr:helix-turn-helix transcriptional regulator [Halorhodospira halochloris]
MFHEVLKWFIKIHKQVLIFIMNHKDRKGQEHLPSYAEQVSVVLRTLRALFNMSQSDLAKASQVSRPTINRVETLRDVDKVRTSTLEALLAVFRRLGVQVQLDEGGLVLSLPMESLMTAIKSGRSQADKEDIVALMVELNRNIRLGDPPALTQEEIRKLKYSSKGSRSKESEE